MILQLVHRLVNEFSFNFILSFKRQPHMMNELGRAIFGHRLLCKEIEDTDVDLPVCLEAVRDRVFREVIRIVVFQQFLELTNLPHFLKYWYHRLRTWKMPRGISTAQVIQLPEYSPGDLSGIVCVFYRFVPRNKKQHPPPPPPPTPPPSLLQMISVKSRCKQFTFLATAFFSPGSSFFCLQMCGSASRPLTMTCSDIHCRISSRSASTPQKLTVGCASCLRNTSFTSIFGYATTAPSCRNNRARSVS
jgi:hypothetical protein